MFKSKIYFPQIFVHLLNLQCFCIHLYAHIHANRPLWNMCGQMRGLKGARMEAPFLSLSVIQVTHGLCMCDSIVMEPLWSLASLSLHTKLVCVCVTGATLTRYVFKPPMENGGGRTKLSLTPPRLSSCPKPPLSPLTHTSEWGNMDWWRRYAF